MEVVYSASELCTSCCCSSLSVLLSLSLFSRSPSGSVLTLQSTGLKALPHTLSGTHFSHVLGTQASILEHFLINDDCDM
jgi:hypothetical protein